MLFLLLFLPHFHHDDAVVAPIPVQTLFRRNGTGLLTRAEADKGSKTQRQILDAGRVAGQRRFTWSGKKGETMKTITTTTLTRHPDRRTGRG